MSFGPSPEQPSFPEDTLPRDLKRDVVGVESYRGWGPHLGPLFYKANPEANFFTDQDGVVQEVYHHHSMKVYNPACYRCRIKYDRTVRSHDYEQLWYRSRVWFRVVRRGALRGQALPGGVPVRAVVDVW